MKFITNPGCFDRDYHFNISGINIKLKIESVKKLD